MNGIRSRLLTTGYFDESKYLSDYIDLISSNAGTLDEIGVTQKHHIIPRRYFALIGSQVDDSQSNVVTLKYSDHIKAHYLLAMCTTGELKKSMCYAFYMVSNIWAEHSPTMAEEDLLHIQELYEMQSKLNHRSPPNKGKKMSEEQKLKISRSLLGHSVSDESRRKMSESQKNMSPDKRSKISEATRNRNYTHSDETRAKMSSALMGHTVSDDVRKKISESSKKQRGNRWYTDGKVAIVVRPGEVPPEGFHPGTNRRHYWYNNGVLEIQISVDCAPPEGYVRGRLKKLDALGE